MLRPRLLLPLLLGLLFFAAPVAADPPTVGTEFFEKQVRPVLVERCFECHGANPKKLRGDLDLRSRAAILEGGETGPAAVAGKPEASLLIKAVRYHDDKLKMPPTGKLKDHEIAALTQWVKLGLPWPDDKVVVAPKKGGKFHITPDQRAFWSFQPVRPVPLPAVKNGKWAASDLDRFILAGLEAKGLTPAAPADRHTLLRRVTFDLTGLPPTPVEVEAFVNDKGTGAYEKVIDRLLASPAYGERWGRHWLDLVRYADSFDARILNNTVMDITESWRYRDWVVNAFNRDLRYDEFVRAQIAGDLGPDPVGVVATGLLAIGNWGGGDADKEKMHTDIIDDQIDVVSKAFLGLTVSCARCHDHKFDPISTEDYYGLAGIFFSTHILPTVGLRTDGPPMLRIPLVSKEEAAKRAQYKIRVAALEKQLQAATVAHYQQFAKEQQAQTAQYLVAAWEYQHRPADQASVSVAAFAAAKKLAPFALKQWLDHVGTTDDYRPMMQTARDVLGKAGVHGWRGAPDCPSLMVNTTKQAVKVLTFTLPPRSVAVHPGPDNGVAVAWQSPISGTLTITGRVSDADPQGGDGIAWIIDHRSADGLRELARGDIANGGAQALNAKGLDSVTVKAGDRIELLVLPKATHICDTTTVELTITAADGSVWDLAGDLLDDVHQGNPHADRRGNKSVWHFLDMAGSNRAKRPAGVDAALAAWRQTASAVAAGKLPRPALTEAATAFQKQFTSADKKSPFWINNPADEQYLSAGVRAELAKLAGELATLKKSPPQPVPVAHGAQEGGIPGTMYAGFRDAKVHARGDYLRLGDVVPRRFPVLLAGDKQPPITKGSGRRELADWLVSPENPLTARVMVNRIWQHHLGEGIVRTPSNFGKLGARPTHPELLDWLARQFVDSGWSIKKMHKLLLLSATYQQASTPTAEALRLDPENLLWGRVNRRRLEAEAVRDSLLAVSGKLDPQAGGPATRDFASARRTLYQLTVRSDRSGFGPLFDLPDSTAPVEQRVISTVAPQALFLLNHPFVLDQNQALAKRLLKEAGDPEARIRRAYLLLYGRQPVTAEVRIGLDFVGRPGATERTWEEYCQVLLCANEFIFVD